MRLRVSIQHMLLCRSWKSTAHLHEMPSFCFLYFIIFYIVCVDFFSTVVFRCGRPLVPSNIRGRWNHCPALGPEPTVFSPGLPCAWCVIRKDISTGCDSRFRRLCDVGSVLLVLFFLFFLEQIVHGKSIYIYIRSIS